jgi:hypothetical protein
MSVSPGTDASTRLCRWCSRRPFYPRWRRQMQLAHRYVQRFARSEHRVSIADGPTDETSAAVRFQVR